MLAKASSFILLTFTLACQPQEERVPVPQVEIDTTPDAVAPDPTAACAAFKAALQDSLAARGLAAQYHLQGATVHVRDTTDLGCLTAFELHVVPTADGPPAQFYVRRLRVGPSNRPQRVHLHIVHLQSQRGLVLVLHPTTGAIQAVGVEEAASAPAI